MEQIDTLINARWVIPVEPEGTVLDNHAVAIQGGRIVDILPWEAARGRFQADTVIQRPRHVVLPGLVNAHTHAAMNLLRGLSDDLPLMRWLQEHIWPAEQEHVGPEFVQDGVEAACAEMIAGGVTTFNDMYFFPEIAARVASQAGMRIAAGMIVIDFPSAYAGDADTYLRKGLETRDAWSGHPLVSTVFAPHAPYTVADDALRRIAVLAEELDVPIHMHVHETAFEVTQSVEQIGKRPLQRLADAGIVTPGLMAVHMTQLNDDDIRLVADSNASVIHCPESNLKLASGYCPVQRLMDAGVTVALGTDGAASNNDLDMFGEMRTAALLGKAVAGDAAALPAARVLTMATLNGARALGLDQETGSLVPGKLADLIAVDLSALESQPIYHPLSQLVYAAGRHQVTDSWIAGRRVLADNALTTLNRDAILEKLSNWQSRLVSKA